jgi:AGCS family alanine or glycine:cation symporter
MKNGIQRNIYITEAGLGTSSIAHGMSDAAVPRNQAILAMYSIIADTFVSCCSGLLVIVTGAWVQGGINNTLVYQLIKNNLPIWGKWIPLCCVILFAVTTIIGNSFNALQSFSYFTRSRGTILFSLFLGLIIFAGSLMYVPLIWKLMDVIMVLVAILHLIGLCILSHRYGYLLK